MISTLASAVASAEPTASSGPLSIRDLLTLIVATCVALTGVFTLFKAFLEYRLQGRQKRAEQFQALRKKLKEDGDFGVIARALDEVHDPTSAAGARAVLRATDFEIKRNYLGLFEEVALSMNSRLIRPEVAHYMFGYYAILCYESDDFWHGVGRLSPYWTLFNSFCDQMKVEQDKLFNALEKDDGRGTLVTKHLRF